MLSTMGIRYHKTLNTLPVGCYDNFMKSGDYAWLCIFDYENYTPPEISEDEKKMLIEAWDKMQLEIPEGILSDEQLYKIEQLTLINYELSVYAKFKDEIGSHGRAKFIKAQNKLNKLKTEHEKQKQETIEQKKEISLADQCIFIERVLKCSAIDIFKRPVLQYFTLLKQAIKTNEYENNRKTE